MHTSNHVRPVAQLRADLDRLFAVIEALDDQAHQANAEAIHVLRASPYDRERYDQLRAAYFSLQAQRNTLYGQYIQVSEELRDRQVSS